MVFVVQMLSVQVHVLVFNNRGGVVFLHDYSKTARPVITFTQVCFIGDKYSYKSFSSLGSPFFGFSFNNTGAICIELGQKCVFLADWQMPICQTKTETNSSTSGP